METNQVLLYSSREETWRNNFWVLLSAVLDSAFFSLVNGTAWISLRSHIHYDAVSDHLNCSWQPESLSEHIAANFSFDSERSWFDQFFVKIGRGEQRNISW